MDWKSGLKSHNAIRDTVYSAIYFKTLKPHFTYICKVQGVCICTFETRAAMSMQLPTVGINVFRPKKARNHH